jgi:hypothetical protein
MTTETSQFQIYLLEERTMPEKKEAAVSMAFGLEKLCKL